MWFINRVVFPFWPPSWLSSVAEESAFAIEARMDCEDYLSLWGSVPSYLSGGQPIFPLITTLHSSRRFRKSRPRFQLWARRKGPVCNGCSVCHGPRPTPHAPGALLRISRPLSAHGQHRWQRAAEPYPRCQFQWWVLASCMASSIVISLYIVFFGQLYTAFWLLHLHLQYINI